MARRSRGAREAGKKCGARRSGGTVPGLSPPPVRDRHRRGEARERRPEPEARPAGSERAAAGARPRRGRGKKNTLFPLGPPPRIMYQDYPGNFDTSSRGSSGSPAHAESYTSGGGQQVGAGPGCTWRRGRTPALLSPPLPLLLSFPIFGLARKFLRGHRCKFWIFVLSCPPFSPHHLTNNQTKKLERGAGLESRQTFALTLHYIQTSSWNCTFLPRSL